MSNSATPHLFGSSESTQKKTLQWQANTNLEVYLMSIPGSRNQKFESSTSSVSSQAAINKETPKISNSEGRPEGADSSLKLNQATATSTTITGPAQTTSLPANLPNNTPETGNSTTDALKKNDTLASTATTRSISLPAQTTSLPVTTDPIPAPENGIVNNSMVHHEQSPTVNGLETDKEANNPERQVDKRQRVCNTCKSKYEKEENTSDVEEWLYSDTCTNSPNVILSHHRSISRLQSPKQHKPATTNYHEEKPHSCCCF